MLKARCDKCKGYYGRKIFNWNTDQYETCVTCDGTGWLEFEDIPTNWAMFSAKGDKRMTQMAQKAYDKMVALVALNSATGISAKKRKVLFWYLVDYERVCNSKTYGEAADTAVREGVWSFFNTLAQSASLCKVSGRSDDLWRELRDESYLHVKEVVSKNRAKKVSLTASSP